MREKYLRPTIVDPHIVKFSSLTKVGAAVVGYLTKKNNFSDVACSGFNDSSASIPPTNSSVNQSQTYEQIEKF